MQPIFDRAKQNLAVVRKHLEAAKVTYNVASSADAVSAVFRGAHGTYVVVVQARTEFIQLYVHQPLTVPLGCRRDIRDAVERINRQLAIGVFEHQEERVFYYAYAILTGATPSDELIRRLITSGLAISDQFAQVFHSVAYANEAPDQAVDRTCEQCRQGGPTIDYMN